jgi:rubrerythrin
MEITDADILKITIRIEREGANFYKDLAMHVTDANTKEFLLCMSKEESLHENQFQKILQSKNTNHYGWENQKRISDMIESQFQTDIFPKVDEIFRNFPKVKGFQKAVELAIEAEKVSGEFYSLLGEYCSNFETKTLLLSMEKNERDHLAQIEILKKTFSI